MIHAPSHNLFSPPLSLDLTLLAAFSRPSPVSFLRLSARAGAPYQADTRASMRAGAVDPTVRPSRKYFTILKREINSAGWLTLRLRRKGILVAE